MLQRILVAIIRSESSHYVFDQALLLAKATGARLGLLHVTDLDETNEELPAYLAKQKPYLSYEDEAEPCCY